MLSEEKFNEMFQYVPMLAADAVLIKDNQILLVKRDHEPYMDEWAVPGGFVEKGETVEHAAERELEEETGIKARAVKLINVYSDPKRDPRGHVVSVAFFMDYVSGETKRSRETKEVEFFPLDKMPELMKPQREMKKDIFKMLGQKD